MAKTFLFDLDMTLVDSSVLANARRAQQWPIVRANLNLIRAFSISGSIAPHELPSALKALGHRVGIVTSSPRWYAEAILALFGIDADVLVAYDDTAEHKPGPEPLQEALRRLGVPASPEVFYVGDDVGDIEASFHAGVTSIGVAWAPTSPYELSSAAPDIFLVRPSRLVKSADDPSKLRYVAEQLASGRPYRLHRGSVLHCDEKVLALGRYFPTADQRHGSSALSAAILSLKSNDETAAMFGRAFSEALAETKLDVDYVVAVPPKPSQGRNRFEVLLNTASQSLSDIEVVLDGLTVEKEIQGYKQMGPGERARAIRGAFSTRYKWNGAKIVLLDDVYTTGETTAECVRVLRANGAGDVVTIALSKDQRSFMLKYCPSCGRSMRMRTNGTTGQKFWGCSGYPENCRHTEDA